MSRKPAAFLEFALVLGLGLGIGFFPPFLVGCERRSLASVSPVASASSASARAEIDAALAVLRREESELRARTDFARQPPSSRALGPNPYALVPFGDPDGVAGKALFAGVTRGDSELVVLDGEARVVARAQAPISPSGVAALSDGQIFVVSELEPRIARYRISGTELPEAGGWSIPGARSLRGLAADERAVVTVDFFADRWFALPVAPNRERSRSRGDTAVPSGLKSGATCGGPFRVELSRSFAAVACLFDHSIAIFARDAHGYPERELGRIVHDGPFWGFALQERGGELLIAAGGVEDHALERRDKVFGHIDSFVYVYRLGRDARLERLAAVNTSELGIVTPKVVRFERPGPGVRLVVLGYGSDRFTTLEWDAEPKGEPRTTFFAGVPGCSDAVVVSERVLCANPLFDAWVVLPRRSGTRPEFYPARVATPHDPSSRERLGEALFFTTLMAPDASSAGRLSRFTCETCHFEGGTDGRVHHSGRDAVRVSTRPLFGLFNGAPHFSRAHDRDLTAVSHNEFAVANRGNPVDPWFPLDPTRFPWLEALGVARARLEPIELRRALLAFLVRFSHAENPLALARATPRHFGDVERRGAELFRERCVRCHAARLVANDATSDVPFERWEGLVLSSVGPIVWSNGEYARTAVLPYVDREGTRTPSLRRLALKRPYLTNGAARSLDALLEQVRLADNELVHAGAVGADGRNLRALERTEQRALVTFLELL